MKYFLYDENNKRLALVDEIFPTIVGTVYNVSPIPTPNSNQERIYNTQYIWENVQLQRASDGISMDHEVFHTKDNKLLFHLPSNDCYLIYGGAYIYTGENKKK